MVAKGSSFALYIDGKPLDHFDDTSYSDGYIALAVDGVAQPNAEGIFTNLKVWQREDTSVSPCLLLWISVTYHC